MDWILTLVGLTCFWLAGKKVWWAWYVGLAGQGLWAVYSAATGQLGFLLGVVAYSFVYVKNAIAWTREHRSKTRPGPVWSFGEAAPGRVVRADVMTPEGYRRVPESLVDAINGSPPKCPECGEDVAVVGQHLVTDGNRSHWECPVDDQPLDERIRNGG